MSARGPATIDRAEGCDHEHALLRRSRAGDEGPGRLRPQGHRPGPQPGGRGLRRRHRSSWPRTSPPPCARSARSTTASPSPGSASTTSSTSCASPASATPTSRATSYSREDVDARSLANQYAQILGQIFTHEMKPMEVEILVAEVGPDAERRPDVPHPLRRHRRGRERASPCSAATPRPSAPACEEAWQRGPGPRPAPSPAAVAALAGPDRTPRRRRPRGGRARPHHRPAPGLPPHRGRRAAHPPRLTSVGRNRPATAAGRPRAAAARRRASA